MAGGDEGMIEELHIAAGAEDDAGSGERRADIGERTGQRKDELPAALIGDLLALRIGVGKQAADGQQQDGAEAKAQPCRRHEARCFTHGDGRYKKKKKGQRARPAVSAADGEEHQDEQREKDVDAHLHTEPSAQRN